MYGMVNKALEDLVICSAGEETWLDIRNRAGLRELQILSSTNYEDEITYRLVAAASEALQQTPESILRSFGKHWVLYTGREGWSSLFAASGADMVSFLHNLDDMHARVNAAMPEGRMPEFNLTANDETYQLEYRSEREGLAPMVGGMLSGLAEQFDETWDIRHTDHRSQCGVDRFVLKRTDMQASDDVQDAA